MRDLQTRQSSMSGGSKPRIFGKQQTILQIPFRKSLTSSATSPVLLISKWSSGQSRSVLLYGQTVVVALKWLDEYPSRRLLASNAAVFINLAIPVLSSYRTLLLRG